MQVGDGQILGTWENGSDASPRRTVAADAEKGGGRANPLLSELPNPRRLHACITPLYGDEAQSRRRRCDSFNHSVRRQDIGRRDEMEDRREWSKPQPRGARSLPARGTLEPCITQRKRVKSGRSRIPPPSG